MRDILRCRRGFGERTVRVHAPPDVAAKMSKSSSRVSAALDIMMRMPPSRVEQSLSGIISIAPDDADELLQRIDQPLQEQVDGETGRKYLICDYNRDGDSYRQVQ